MQAWEDFIQKQEGPLGTDAVSKWLRTLKIVHFDSGNLYLEAQDSFQVLWFEEHIRPQLKSKFVNNNFRPIKVHLTLAESLPKRSNSKFLKKEKGAVIPPVHFFKDKIDPAMTLENFITTDSNKIVFELFCQLTGYNATTQILEDPKIALASFNPIYLWGGGGSGKTHLLMAITQAFKKQGLNAHYARAETFTEHVVAAIRESQMQDFRKTYRNVDILLIDDVDVFARKNATQEEFFHTFNTLHSSNRQIILSSKCNPAQLEEIEPRLISRFEWGISLHFEKLNLEDLKKVLEYRSKSLGFPLLHEVNEYLLETFPTSHSLLQALEALVLRSHLGSNAQHKGNSLSIDLQSAKKMLNDLSLEEKKKALTPEKIITAISAAFGIRNEDLLGNSQAQVYSFPRQIAMYLCRLELKLPFQGIGRIFSRDHSTVMTSIRQIEKKMKESDRELLSYFSEIQIKLRGRYNADS